VGERATAFDSSNDAVVKRVKSVKFGGAHTLSATLLFGDFLRKLTNLMGKRLIKFSSMCILLDYSVVFRLCMALAF
jgi:hypothetical protein